MLKKLLAALVASAFALSVFAQAPKSGTEKAEPKGQTGVTTEKAEPGKGKSDAAKKTKAKSKAKTEVKGDAKDSRKDATKASKKSAKKDEAK
jgi:hypothetical protein